MRHADSGETLTEILAGLRITETVVAALRLAATRRDHMGSLDTQTLLQALESVDPVVGWHRFTITDRPVPDPPGRSSDTWSGVPLTAHCAAALSRARALSKAYDLLPMPAGVLAIALAWDSDSGAARSFVGTTHDELICALQDNILGVDLEDMPSVLAKREAPPTDAVLPAAP